MKTRLLFLLGMLAAVGLSADTTSGVATCTQAPASPVALTDKPNHAFAIGKSQCGWTGFELGGLASKSGVATDLEEITGDSEATVRGYFVSTMINGDTHVARYQGSAKMKDGKFVSGQGTFVFTSGTGKLKGIKGKGTYKGTPNPDGTISFKVEGEYRVSQ
ncbi:MAG TPA: hypothetical protein VFL12_08620 [Thermoanaerobaculia bacterium]|nr:hypothetical protein [Thermoanaerobaculia bacterium]